MSLAARKQTRTVYWIFQTSNSWFVDYYRQLRSITTAKQFARLIFADYLVSNVPKLTGKLCEP